MQTLYQKVADRLERLKEDIRQNMEAKNINASHRTEKALSVVRYDGGVKLVLGAGEVAPLGSLENGQPPMGWSPSFVEVIRRWSIDKGIQFGSDRERNTFAYFASKKISREGTLRHKSPEDVYSSATRQALRDIYPTISKEFSRIITTKIR